MTILAQAQEIKLESLADGPGLLPFRLGPTKLTTHYHTFLQYLPLTDIEDKIELIKTQLQHSRDKLENQTYNLYEFQLDYLSEKLDKALDQLQSLEPNRVKRGLVDGLGSVIKSITGNLDYNDAIKYNDALLALKNDQLKITSGINKHISLNKEWMNRHSNLMVKLVDNQSRINKTLQLILESNAYAESSLIKYAKFAQLLVILSENIDDLASELRRIEDSLAFIRASSTHHSILSIDVLDGMLKKLRNLYDRDQILDIDLREYYNIIKPGSYYTDRTVVLVFNVPIVAPTTYDLYKLSILPNKYNQSIIPPYPFIATNEKAFVYIETECPKVNQQYLCEEKINHQLKLQPDCIQKLIVNQRMDQSCQPVTISLSKEAMEKLDDAHYSVIFPKPTKVQLSCGREDHIVLNGSYLITIPHNCLLRTTEFTIANINDHIEGQPLKILRVPEDVEMKAIARPTINLNSINLEEMHDIQSRISLQPQLRTGDSSPGILYHTTIPFYMILLAAFILTIVLKRYNIIRFCKRGKPTTTGTAEKHTYEDPDAASSKNKMPATFFLKVQK